MALVPASHADTRSAHGRARTSDDVGGLLAVPRQRHASSARRYRYARAPRRSSVRVCGAAQTPQMFRYDSLQRALAHCAEQRIAVTDEAQAVEALGLAPRLVAGIPHNIKITHREDLVLAEAILRAARSMSTSTRVGMGIDVHALRTGTTSCSPAYGSRMSRACPRIPTAMSRSMRFATHCSEPRVLAISACTFPIPTRNGEAPRARSCCNACPMLTARGFAPVNVDITILAERPRIGPYRDAMRRRLAELLRLEPEAVNVKATTTEQLGLIGRGEGIAALAVVLVETRPRRMIQPVPGHWRRLALDPPRAHGPPYRAASCARLRKTSRCTKSFRSCRMERPHCCSRSSSAARTPNGSLRARAHSRVRVRDVGFAGLKDRHAVTAQWFSVPHDSATGADWLALQHPEFEVCEVHPHSRKLRRGALAANRFRICVREIDGIARTSGGKPGTDSPARCAELFRVTALRHRKAQTSNLSRVRALEGGQLPRARSERSFAFSAARSLLFNAVLAERVVDRSWDCLRRGDVNLDGTGSIFGSRLHRRRSSRPLQQRSTFIRLAHCGALARFGPRRRVREIEAAVSED